MNFWPESNVGLQVEVCKLWITIIREKYNAVESIWLYLVLMENPNKLVTVCNL